ncbi:hypothetical protein ACFE04_013003 [Oxalis oulophora]
MEHFSLSRSVLFVVFAMVVLVFPVYGQVTTPCSASMINSVTPCMNFLTNSSGNVSSPSTDCCNSLKSLTSSSMSCACLIVTGSVPFQVPINRTLAISLPRACNMPGVPLQCKASVAPAPAPGPAAFGPTVSPQETPSPSPKGSVAPQPTSSSQAPESDLTPLQTPPSSTTTGGSSRSVQPASAATSSHSLSPSLLLFALGFVLLKYY